MIPLQRGTISNYKNNRENGEFIMKRQNLIKKSMVFILSVIMMFTSSTVLAREDMDLQEDREYLIVNGTEIVYEGEDYENPETGEYIRWNTNSRSVSKEFSFKIRYSLVSSSFNVSSDSIYVHADADVRYMDADGAIQNGYDGHRYTVTIFSSSIFDNFSKDLEFEVNGIRYAYSFSVDKNQSYKVKIVNNDYLDDYYYLVGSGTIESL